jgi:hypothetical protein
VTDVRLIYFSFPKESKGKWVSSNSKKLTTMQKGKGDVDEF